MSDYKNRIVKAILVMIVGIFFSFFYFFLLASFGSSLWAIWLIVFVCFFKAFLYLLSYFNRKRHDYYFKKEFNLDNINKLNRNLNIIDNINKYSLLVFYIIMGIIIFVASNYDFYTLIIVIVYIYFYGRG